MEGRVEGVGKRRRNRKWEEKRIMKWKEQSMLGDQYKCTCTYAHALLTCQHSSTDPNQKDNEPTRASVPEATGPAPPAESSVLMDPLVPQAVPVPVSYPVYGVEIIVVPEEGRQDVRG